MTTDQIRFDDGQGYEQYMGLWSRLAGAAFLDWLAPAAGLRWLDVGCGNGAFTESILERAAPAFVDGIDPSDAQLAFARTRLAGRAAAFRQGDAMALPFADADVDVAVMPLVIFFVPEPPRGVAEMARVIRPGGIAAAYAWDMDGGGFPYHTLQREMRAMDIPVPTAPSEDASRLDVMRGLWTNAGLEDVETRAITVERSFAGLDDYWTTVLKAPSVGRQLRALSSNAVAELQARLRASLPAPMDGRIVCQARANAVKGRRAVKR
jgi:SAM-dependent methyltransferase